ncbi:hypothetical protein HK100_010319, partial [Physocladia obscura]
MAAVVLLTILVLRSRRRWPAYWALLLSLLLHAAMLSQKYPASAAAAAASNPLSTAASPDSTSHSAALLFQFTCWPVAPGYEPALIALHLFWCVVNLLCAILLAVSSYAASVPNRSLNRKRPRPPTRRRLLNFLFSEHPNNKNRHHPDILQHRNDREHSQQQNNNDGDDDDDNVISLSDHHNQQHLPVTPEMIAASKNANQLFAICFVSAAVTIWGMASFGTVAEKTYLAVYQIVSVMTQQMLVLGFQRADTSEDDEDDEENNAINEGTPLDPNNNDNSNRVLMNSGYQQQQQQQQQQQDKFRNYELDHSPANFGANSVSMPDPAAVPSRFGPSDYNNFGSSQYGNG